MPPVEAQRQFSDEVEIVIEAEPPSMDYKESFPSFDTFQPMVEASSFPSMSQDRPHATMLGLGKPGLPQPPAGMPFPPGIQSSEPERYDPAAYNAIAKLSREIIERIVWEVVPDLAERIIREELDRLVEKRRSG